jgi:hypothetical protein
VNRFGALETHFFGCLLHRLLGKSHKLLYITNRSLNVHVWNIEAERWELNCNHLLRRSGVFAKLLDVQGTSKKTKRCPRRCGNQIALRIESPIEIC